MILKLAILTYKKYDMDTSFKNLNDLTVWTIRAFRVLIKAGPLR